MPGAPIKVATLRAVAEQGGWGPILERIADGEPMSKIAREFKVSRSFFVGLLHADEERSKLVKGMRAEIAQAIADQTLEIADDENVKDREQVAKADLRIRVRQWLAARYSPAQFGDKKGDVNVQVNIDGLYLDALRRANVGELPALPAEVVAHDPEDGRPRLPGDGGAEGASAEAEAEASAAGEGGTEAEASAA